MVIEISSGLRPVICGSRLYSSTKHLHGLLGRPTRIVEPAASNRSRNRSHVYDEDGVYFVEHLETRNIEACCIVFRPEEQNLPFSPVKAFSVNLIVADYVVPSHPDLLPFLRDCPIQFQQVGSAFGASLGACSLMVTSAAANLPSGEAGSTLSMIDILLSWQVGSIRPARF